MNFNPMASIPSRNGARWNEDETRELLNSIRKKKTIVEIAAAHERTTTSISNRLIEVAADFHFFDARPTEEIMKYTGLTHKQVVNAIERRKAKIMVAEKRKVVPAEPAHVEPVEPVTKDSEKPVLTFSPLLEPANDVFVEMLEILRDIQKKVGVLERVRVRVDAPV
jgi:hypothetical protein